MWPTASLLAATVLLGNGSITQHSTAFKPKDLDEGQNGSHSSEGRQMGLYEADGRMPDMTFLINGRDEPRIAFNYRALGAREAAVAPKDSTPFTHAPRPTVDFFAQQSGCNIPAQATGIMESVNGDSGFLLASAKPGYTTDLYPMLSMSKISPCFADILFPTEYYYDRSWWAPHFSHPDNIPWEAKKVLACMRAHLPCKLALIKLTCGPCGHADWRRMSTGGMITVVFRSNRIVTCHGPKNIRNISSAEMPYESIGSNDHHFARFRLVDISRSRPDSDLVDATSKITLFAETLCADGCDRAAVMSGTISRRAGGSLRVGLLRFLLLNLQAQMSKTADSVVYASLAVPHVQHSGQSGPASGPSPGRARVWAARARRRAGPGLHQGSGPGLGFRKPGP
ncbi:hypothetical protein GGX14DRAFT_624941 [Mycena pura]|uniref:Uncharacterized protein n=1 Tax=Mycena pura TaxID=153505 RepID=A0AAD6VIT0_9AGAR|nr:hypothetical protein GGX14DRAFT_624941 [Mycena pura]